MRFQGKGIFSCLCEIDPSLAVIFFFGSGFSDMQSVIVSCKNCGAKNRIPAIKQHLGPKCGKCGDLIDMGSAAVPVELNDNSFAEFIGRASLPMLVDFYSPTCGPCQMMAPTVDSLAKKFFKRIIVAKLDTSRNQMTAAHYKIRAVPTLFFFRNGRIVDQITGAVPESTLLRKLNGLL